MVYNSAVSSNLNVCIHSPLKSVSSVLGRKLSGKDGEVKPDTTPPINGLLVWWAWGQHTFTFHRLTSELFYSPKPVGILPANPSLADLAALLQTGCPVASSWPGCHSSWQLICMSTLLHYSDNPKTLLPCHHFANKAPPLHIKVTQFNEIYSFFLHT